MNRRHKSLFVYPSIILFFLLCLMPSYVFDIKANVNFDNPVLIITDNAADYELATLIKANNQLNITIKDINWISNLNQLFHNEKYFDNFQSIILIMNQIANPFNESLQSDLEQFVATGGIFGIVSAQIWKFPSSFYTLFGIQVPSQGQKEYPLGNQSTSVDIFLNNDSTLSSFETNFSDSIVSMEGCVGISWSLDQTKEIASIYTPSGNATLTAFSQEMGYLFAIPLSPVYYSVSIENTSILISRILEMGLNFVNDRYSSESYQNNSTNVNILFLSLSEEPLETLVILGTSIALLSVLIYFVLERIEQRTPKIDLKVDKSFFLSYVIGPIFAIGQILYPPTLRRINRQDVVENEYRSRIIAILKERDFLHFRELKRELKIGTSSLKWHLQVLEDFRIIKKQDYGQYEIYFLYHRIPDSNFLDIYFAIVSGGGYRVAQAFSRVNSWDLNTLAEYVGQSKEATRYHVKKFEDLKILEFVNHRYILQVKKEKLLHKSLQRRKRS